MVLIPRNSRPVLAGFLAVLLYFSPAAALRMLVTERFVNLLGVQGEWVRAKLRLARRTPPLPIELARPLVVRKAEEVKSETPFDRDEVGALNGAARRASIGIVAAEPRPPVRIREFHPEHGRAPPSDLSS